MHLFGFNITELIQTAGYAGLFFIVFAESGLFFGFIFPGDSLLFAAGLAASQDLFDIRILTFLIATAAITGDSTGFLIGHRFGSWIRAKKGKFFIHEEHLNTAAHFFKKYGKKTLIFARFIPGVRTFAPITAGMSGMKYKSFVPYSITGGLLWGAGVTILGYYLGESVPDIERYIIPIIGVIVIISIIPPIIERRLLKKK